MNRGWSMTVRDGQGRSHQGSVWLRRRAPSHVTPLPRNAAFQLVLAEEPSDPEWPVGLVAACVPSRKVRLDPSGVGEPVWTRSIVNAYGSGRVVGAPPGIDARQVFPRGAGHPRLELLAAALLDAAAAEAIAPYTAFIRRELRLRSGADALQELAGRLDPAVVSERPPRSAPAVRRLRAALRALEKRTAPALDLEQFHADLRFLQLFSPSEPVLDDEGARRLLADVASSPPTRRRATLRRVR